AGAPICSVVVLVGSPLPGPTEPPATAPRDLGSARPNMVALGVPAPVSWKALGLLCWLLNLPTPFTGRVAGRVQPVRPGIVASPVSAVSSELPRNARPSFGAVRWLGSVRSVTGRTAAEPSLLSAFCTTTVARAEPSNPRTSQWVGLIMAGSRR